MMRRVAILLLCLVTLRCGGDRSATDEARAYFAQRYPYAELLDVKLSEDDSGSRAFVFSYRRAGQEQTGEVAIRFVEDQSTGRWSPQPDEPLSLP